MSDPIDLIDVLEAVVVYPGDVLIVRLPSGVHAQAAFECRERVKTLLPDLADVVVIGCEQLAVYRPSDELTEHDV